MEADHIVTVSNLILIKGSLKKSLRLALNWALGHSLTLTVLAALIFVLDSAFMTLMSNSAEQMVGATMIFLGMIVFSQELKRSYSFKISENKNKDFSTPQLFLSLIHI